MMLKYAVSVYVAKIRRLSVYVAEICKNTQLHIVYLYADSILYNLFVTLNKVNKVNKVLYVIRIKCCLSSGLICDRTMSTYIEINSLATNIEINSLATVLMYSELLQAL